MSTIDAPAPPAIDDTHQYQRLIVGTVGPGARDVQRPHLGVGGRQVQLIPRPLQRIAHLPDAAGA